MGLFLIPIAHFLARLLRAYRPTTRAAVITVSIVLVTALWTKDFFPKLQTEPVQVLHARSLISQLPSSHTVVKLMFDDLDWPGAVCVALELKRERIMYSIDDDWAFMFGSGHAVERTGRAEVTWKVGHDGVLSIRETPDL